MIQWQEKIVYLMFVPLGNKDKDKDKGVTPLFNVEFQDNSEYCDKNSKRPF